MVLTSATPIASPPPPAPHDPPLLGISMPEKINTRAKATCKPAESASGRPSLPCSRNMSASAAILIDWLRHDAYVGDAGTLDGIHDRGKGAEGHILVSPNEDRLVLRVANLLAQLGLDVVDVDGIIAQEYALLLVDTDHHALFGDFFDGARLRNIYLDAR